MNGVEQMWKIRLRNSKISILVFSILFTGFFGGCDKKSSEDISSESTSSTAVSIQISKEIVAKVNGEPIYADKLDELVQKQLQKDKRFSSSGSHPAQVAVVKKKILNKLINDEVLRQASIKESVPDFNKKLKKELEVINEKFGSEEKFKNYVASKKMTDAQFSIFLKEKIHLSEYFKKYGLDDPDIPEEKIRDFYDKGKNNFRREELVKVSHILLSVEENADPMKKKKIQDKADELRQMLMQNKDFAQIAKEYSDSAEANESGGDLGFIKKGYMPTAFDEVAFSLKQGEVSEPVLTQFGYHILKVTDKQPARISPYEEVRDFIRKYLQEGEIIKNSTSHIKKLRQEAKIEIINNQSESIN